MFRPYDVAQVKQIMESLLEKGFSQESIEKEERKMIFIKRKYANQASGIT